jgi:hypothetical protein
MQKEIVSSDSIANAGMNLPVGDEVKCAGVYTLRCFDKPGGDLLWEQDITNLWTTLGKNNTLDNQLSGSAYTAAWYMGLITSTGYTAVAAGDTMSSHSGWSESSNYSQSTRPSLAWSSASAGSKALSSAAQFTMNATDTIVGCFITSNSTKAGTTGTLFSAGAFTGGNQPVVTGNALAVSYTASIT